MLRTITTAALWIALVVLSRPAAAQSSYMCSGDGLAQMQEASRGLDYAAACESFNQCTDVHPSMCQLRAAVMLAEACDDATCDNRALLAAAALSPAYWDGYLLMPEEADLKRVLPVGMSLVIDGSYDTAAETYLKLENSEYNPMLRLSSAIGHRMNGDYAAALHHVNAALARTPTNALVNYVRVLVLADLERTEDAAFAAYTLGGIVANDPVLAPFIEALQADYPLDLSAVEEWLMYPVFLHGGGPGGPAHVSMYKQPARPVRLLLGNDGEVALFDVFTAEEAWVYEDVRALVARFPGAAGFDSTEGSVYLSLTLVDGGYQLMTAANGFEFTLTEFYLLAPADAPDPRGGYATAHCGLLSALTPGQYVEDIRTFMNLEPSIDVYDTPGGTVTATLPYVRLLDETLCKDDAVWWLSDGGWVRANDGDSILLAARSYLVFPLYCPGVLPPRLGHGSPARVIPGSGPHTVRREPTLDSRRIGVLPENAEFAVTGDPVCAEGYVWWQVGFNGLTGWTAEGEGDTYWLEPLP